MREQSVGVHRRPITQDQVGTVFEQGLMLQCIYLNRALRKGWTFSAYRTESGAEVELVVEREDDIVGIEIKAGRNVSGSDSRGLLSLSETIGRYKPLQKWVPLFDSDSYGESLDTVFWVRSTADNF
jgi:hypothetical protein